MKLFDSDGMFIPKKFMRGLIQKNYIVMNIVAFVFSFAAYFSCYAFRKPFTVNKYENVTVWGISFKVILLIVQLVGYTLSKFLGIFVDSSMDSRRRPWTILTFIGLAELALLLFAVTPVPYSAIWMFFNGLPLGMIWGLVFGYLEGRRTSEFLGAGMCVSFIVSSGAVKSVGKSLLNTVSAAWMPVLTGALFLPVLVFSVFMLECVPPPSAEDIKSRTERIIMTPEDKKEFLKKFWPGLLALVIFYMVLAGYRDFRDNFSPEIWEQLGTEEPSIYTVSELIVAIAVVIPVLGLMFIRSTIVGFMAYHGLIILSCLVFGVVTLVYSAGKVRDDVWMVLTGVGCYIPYVPFNSIIFDRMIAAFRSRANSNFIFYVADFLGYLTAVGIMLYKNFGVQYGDWVSFFKTITYVLMFGGSVLILLSGVYFWVKYRLALRSGRVSEAHSIHEEKNESSAGTPEAFIDV